jgi:hypothetical protein
MTQDAGPARTRPTVLIAIRDEFVRIERDGSAKQGLRSRGHRGGTLVAAALVGLIALSGAAAASGLVRTVLPDGERDVHADAGQEFVVATGSSPVAGGWRLTSLHHDAEDGAGPGDCLKLALTSPPAGTASLGTLLCQREGEAKFKANGLPVVDTATGQAETLVFGAVPRDASSVMVRGSSARAELRAAPQSPGNAWLVAIPSSTKTAEISWTEDGKTRDTLDLAPYLDQLHIWERNILGVR